MALVVVLRNQEGGLRLIGGLLNDEPNMGWLEKLVSGWVFEGSDG